MTLTLSWRRSLSYRNQSIDLLCKSRTGFYMIGTFAMKELKITTNNGLYLLDVFQYYKNTRENIQSIKCWIFPSMISLVTFAPKLTLKKDMSRRNQVIEIKSLQTEWLSLTICLIFANFEGIICTALYHCHCYC